MRQATTIAAAALACTSVVASEAACRGPQPATAPAGLAGARSGQRRSTAPNDASSRVVGQQREGETLLALAGDRLLLWTVHGRARTRSVTGEWSELTLPLVGVHDVLAKGADLLVDGQDPTGRPALSWVSADGKEIQRWALPKEAAFGSAIDVTKMRIVIGSAVGQLEPNGVLGPLQPVPEDVHRTGSGGPRWHELAGATIVCHGANPSMEYNAPGHCRHVGAQGWEFEGPFWAPPLECGSWLIVSSSADGKVLELRDQVSGQRQGRASLPTVPLLACAGPDELLLGTRELTLRRLPSLEVVWRHPVGKSAVSELAVMEHFIAYVVTGSPDVHLAPRPAR